MNIFKALSEGKGRISETNITSFMSYLLDSSNDLNSAFLVIFLSLIDEHLDSGKLFDLLELKSSSVREQILTFKDHYEATSEPEYSIMEETGKIQVPDILLRITSKQKEEDIAYIIIENKINKNSIKKGQIEKQRDYLKRSDDFVQGKPVYSLLITPDERAFEGLMNQPKLINEKSVWLKWTNHIEKEKSIESALIRLIKHEHNAEIEPIDINTQFILKSFIDYISTEFSYRENGKKNFNYNGFEEVARVDVKLDNKSYRIKRFSNNMIRLFDEKDELLKIDVKPVLRLINNEHNLDVSLFHSTGVEKNTQILGRDIIKKLQANNPIT